MYRSRVQRDILCSMSMRNLEYGSRFEITIILTPNRGAPALNEILLRSVFTETTKNQELV